MVAWHRSSARPDWVTSGFFAPESAPREHPHWDLPFTHDAKGFVNIKPLLLRATPVLIKVRSFPDG